MPETHIIIGGAREALGYLVRKQKRDRKFALVNYIGREAEIKDVFNDLRLMVKTCSPVNDTGDSDDSEFYGFFCDLEGNEDMRHPEIGEETNDRKEVIRIFGECTEEWKDARQKYETLKEEIGRM